VDTSSPISSVIPSLDGRVLATLARTERALTGQKVAALASASQSGVHTVLQRLVEHGLVTAERHGNAILYLANRRHVAWSAVEQLANLRRTVLGRLEEAVAVWGVPPLSVIVFGSFARGDGDASSDVDVLVVRPDELEDEDSWRAAVHQLASDLETWTGNPAQVVTMMSDELTTTADEHPDFLDNVREDGVVVFGSPLVQLLGLLAVSG
jgi:predicted nucleotidyltransferase